PESSFGPREAGVTAAAGRRNRAEYAAGLRIDLLYTVLGNLEQVLSVECRSGMRSDIDGADCAPARRIDGVQLVTGCEPDVLAVECNAMHLGGAGKRSILAENFSCRLFHVPILVARQGAGE